MTTLQSFWLIRDCLFHKVHCISCLTGGIYQSFKVVVFLRTALSRAHFLSIDSIAFICYVAFLQFFVDFVFYGCYEARRDALAREYTDKDISKSIEFCPSMSDNTLLPTHPSSTLKRAAAAAHSTRFCENTKMLINDDGA
jgi:hypothetical protein